MTTVRALVAAVTLLAAVAPAYAQTFVPTGRETLRGLPGVEVIVEPLPPELEAAGLSAAALRADVTARLAAAGVPVYASQGENPSPANAYLYVHVNALPLPDAQGYAATLLVQLRQGVDLVEARARVVDAMTWDAHNVLTFPPGDFTLLRRELDLYVDLFIDDWDAVH